MDGEGAEASKAGVVAGVVGEAMEVDRGPGSGDAEASGVVGEGGEEVVGRAEEGSRRCRRPLLTLTNDHLQAST